MSFGNFKNDQPPLAGEGGRENFDQGQYTTNHQKPIERVLDAIRDRGGRVNRSGGQWMCTCPAHDDRTPSLSVKEGDDGRALLKCFAGCSVESIVSALGMQMRDLFPDDTRDSDTFRPQHTRNPQSVAVAHDTQVDVQTRGYAILDEAIDACARLLGGYDHSWDYHNESGDLVGMVLRRDLPGGKKDCRPISLIKGRWEIAGMPTPRPLYRLPELLASDAPVIVCEGEKATDAAIACGYTATTSPHGCGSAAQADWSVLQNRDVIIIPDLNDAGEAYAIDVVSLCETAKSVRVIDLTQAWAQLGDGDDIADVLAIEDGNTDAVREKLDALIERTPFESTLSNSEETASGFHPFPTEILPEPVRSYVAQGAEAIFCDPSYIALPVLTMLAGAIGNTHEVCLKDGWNEPCVIWSCIVGRSGTAKSPAIELAFKPLMSIQNELFHEYQTRCKDAESNGEPLPPGPSRVIIGDTTIEATLQKIQENPHGLVQHKDEIANWFDFDRYSKGKGVGAASRWIELFHARPVSVDRRTQDSIFVQRAALSVTGGIQPGTLRQILDRKNIESGLAARFLFAMPKFKPKRWTEVSIARGTQEAMQSLVEGLYAHDLCRVPPDASQEQPRPYVIPLSPEAKAVFAGFANTHNESMLMESEAIAAAWAKLECYVPRLALILHLVREQQRDPTLVDPELIDEDSIRSAITLVEWFKQETKRLYSVIMLEKQDQELMSLVEWIQTKGGAITKRELSRGPVQYRGSKKAQKAIDLLVEQGFGTLRAREGGRSMEFVLHAKHMHACDSDTLAAEAPKNPQTVTGASGRYPVLSNRKEQ
ncbi:MAG: DUF3987 domain-containing protein [Phycisphaerales bacterium JB052]